MEPDTNQPQKRQNADNGFVYVFDTKENTSNESVSTFRQKICQIFPVVCASMMCVPYGLMLGWPSPTYPLLLKSESLLPISIDQSAMIAGFLMIGNTLGAPISVSRKLASKYGIIVAVSLMLLGWILMWGARNIYWLLGSRFLVGLGNGFGTGQLKIYISEICQDSLSGSLVKQINLYVFFGVVLAFGIGISSNFRQHSMISLAIGILVLFLAIFLPSTPTELLKNGKPNEAKKLLHFLTPQLDVSEGLNKIKEKINSTDTSLTFFQIMKKSNLRNNFVIFACLVLLQQFSGIVPTIVYCEIIFKSCHCPRPELSALLYSFTFLLANIYSINCVSKNNKKIRLLLSAIGVSILLLANIIILVENVNDKLWNFSSLIILLLYCVTHTIGLGNVPFQMIGDMFPKNAIQVITIFFVMWHSMLGLIITKIFQVMFDRLGLFAPLCLFLAVSLFAIIFVIIYVPSKPSKNAPDQDLQH